MLRHVFPTVLFIACEICFFFGHALGKSSLFLFSSLCDFCLFVFCFCSLSLSYFRPSLSAVSCISACVLWRPERLVARLLFWSISHNVQLEKTVLARWQQRRPRNCYIRLAGMDSPAHTKHHNMHFFFHSNISMHCSLTTEGAVNLIPLPFY